MSNSKIYLKKITNKDKISEFSITNDSLISNLSKSCDSLSEMNNTSNKFPVKLSKSCENLEKILQNYNNFHKKRKKVIKRERYLGPKYIGSPKMEDVVKKLNFVLGSLNLE